MNVFLFVYVTEWLNIRGSRETCRTEQC